ncbi:NYN domain-containing protein [Bosea sp. OK403]|uniref:NYN domain-containing protein n=1 Tax=Bosea sp. OK403 TaxID=1855286 RepID=UPI0008E783CC|nr:NYN domain-containing protein [Bosea sp. OK403]SFJ48617.1 NYN domain-containing protein [Bosea sp. OK403]
MPLAETIRVIQPGKRRIKLFVDFWNVVISARKVSKLFEIDVIWDKLSEAIVNQTRQGHFDESNGELAGCHIFGSFSRSNSKESIFIDDTLDKYGSVPGLFFNFSERIPKRTSRRCSSCGESIKISGESGVDLTLAIDMIKHAAMREHEYLALVSSDRDFMPLLDYLKDQGQRVLHVATNAPDRDMRSVTWTQIDLSPHYSYLSRIIHEGCIVLTAPSCSAELEELLLAAPFSRENIRIIDITNKNEIDDKDLSYLMTNRSLYWRRAEDEDGDYSKYSFSRDNISEFRAKLSAGHIYGDLPYAMVGGECETYFSGNKSGARWMQMGGRETRKSWPKLFRD